MTIICNMCKKIIETPCDDNCKTHINKKTHEILVVHIECYVNKLMIAVEDIVGCKIEALKNK